MSTRTPAILAALQGHRLTVGQVVVAVQPIDADATRATLAALIDAGRVRLTPSYRVTLALRGTP